MNVGMAKGRFFHRFQGIEIVVCSYIFVQLVETVLMLNPEYATHILEEGGNF
jgi:hypothetical protein